jgi:hypothetical protein
MNLQRIDWQVCGTGSAPVKMGDVGVRCISSIFNTRNKSHNHFHKQRICDHICWDNLMPAGVRYGDEAIQK